MRHSIGSLSKLSGVSIRALHHYDQIGLLQPSEVAQSGYRYYDDAAVERLWQILFYRELDFPLGEIAQILSSPAFDRNRALMEHRNLLLQKRERLNRLIELVSNAMKGETNMEFKPFDTSEIDALREQYAEEAKARWGNTEAKAPNAPRNGRKRTKPQWRQNPAKSSLRLRRWSAEIPLPKRYRRWLTAGKRLSAKATTTAPTRFSRVLVRCISRTSASQRTSINMAQVRRNS